MSEESDKLNRIADANRIAALEATPYDFGACVRQVLEIDRLRAKLAEVERQRDLALEGEREKACQRDTAERRRKTLLEEWRQETEMWLVTVAERDDAVARVADLEAASEALLGQIGYWRKVQRGRGEEVVHEVNGNAVQAFRAALASPPPLITTADAERARYALGAFPLCPEHAIRLPCPACGGRTMSWAERVDKAGRGK